MKKEIENKVKVKKTNTQETSKSNKKTCKQTQKNNKQKSVKSKKKTNKKLRRILSIIMLVIIFLTLVALIVLSNLFNIKTIKVMNNSKISEISIINASELAIGDNMFRTLNKTIKDRIKKEPYIEDVQIKKKLNGEVIITVKEREATYMLQNENGYAYINNQGYILELSETPLELPIIKGYETQNITAGERLIEADLRKLDLLIQIMENAKSNGISEKISSINISNKENFILEIPTENKTVQFGDEANISVKMLWIIELLEKTKGTPGEIILNVPDIKKVYFRESIGE